MALTSQRWVYTSNLLIIYQFFYYNLINNIFSYNFSTKQTKPSRHPVWCPVGPPRVLQEKRIYLSDPDRHLPTLGSECQSVRSYARVAASDRPNQRMGSLASPDRSFHRLLSSRAASRRDRTRRGSTPPRATAALSLDATARESRSLLRPSPPAH